MYFTSYLIFGTCIVGFNLACKTFTVQEYYATKTYYESFMSVFTESSTDDDLAYGDEFNAKEHIVYEYHTAHTVTLHEIREKLPKYVDTIRSHGFNPAAETKIFVHGFLSEASIIRDYANAYLRIGQYNFFGVNWTEGSSSTYNYYEVKEYVPKVRIIILSSAMSNKRSPNLTTISTLRWQRQLLILSMNWLRSII